MHDPTKPLPDYKVDPPLEEDPKPHKSWCGAYSALQSLSWFLDGMREEQIGSGDLIDYLNDETRLMLKTLDGLEERAVEVETQRLREEWR